MNPPATNSHANDPDVPEKIADVAPFCRHSLKMYIHKYDTESCAVRAVGTRTDKQ